MHASRQVAIVPVFRRTVARTPHCCLPKHTAGSPRVPSSLARSPTPFAKGKRNARRAFAALVTATPCWQMPRNRPDCSPSGQFEWQPGNFVARRSPTGKGDPGRILSLLARVGASRRAQWQIKGVTSVCVCVCACAFFFFLAMGPAIHGDAVPVAAVCRSTGSHYVREEEATNEFSECSLGKPRGNPVASTRYSRIYGL